MMNILNNLRLTIIKQIPTLLSVAIIAGSIVVSLTEFSGYLINGLHLLVGSLLYLLYKLYSHRRGFHSLSRQDQLSLPRINITSGKSLFTLFLVLFSFNIVAHQYYSYVTYVSFLTLLFLLTLLQYLITPRWLNNNIYITVQLVLILTTIVSRPRLKHFFYYGRPDLLSHVQIADQVASTGVEAITGVYSNFPLWYILVAQIKLITEHSGHIWYLAHLVGFFLIITGMLGTYLLSKKIFTGKSRTMVMIVFVTIPVVLFFLPYSIPRSLSLALLPVLLYSIISLTYPSKLVFIVVSVAFISSHPASPPFLLFILLMTSGVILVSKNEMLPSLIRQRIGITVLFIILFFAWIINSPTLSATLFTRFLFISNGIGSSEVITGSSQQVLTSPIVYVSRQYFSILYLLLAIAYDKTVTETHTDLYSTVMISSFVLFILSVPTPLNLIELYNDTLHLTRLQQYTYPFIALGASLGVIKFLSLNIRRVGIFIIVLLLASSAFLLPMLHADMARDTDIYSQTKDKGYLAESEYSSIKFMQIHTTDQVYTDRIVDRFIINNKDINRFRHIIYDRKNHSVVNVGDGIILLRQETANKNHILVFDEQNNNYRTYGKPQFSINQQTKVFTSGSSIGYYK